MTLPTKDRKALEAIHSIFTELEKNSIDSSFDEELLQDLKAKIKALALSGTSVVAKLASTEKHLNGSMTLKHFVAFLVPFERLLNKPVEDSDFLVMTKDRKQKSNPPMPLVFVLDNIRSAFNVGSILRTAECLHAEKAYLCGYTPSPDQAKVEKTAMGTQNFIAWETHSQISTLLHELKAAGYCLIALETAEKSKSIFENFSQSPTAFIVGNERFGLESDILKLADEIRIIPLHGQKNSLNVGVSLGVAGFEWMRQWEKWKK